ncbi:MAG: hypothetical protein E4G94_01390, partial [ANME-2 cluster archaeon]
MRAKHGSTQKIFIFIDELIEHSIVKYVWIVVPFTILLLHLNYYYSATPDDAYISFRYIKNFVEGNGLTYNVGEYVEGYSNALWVILI